MSFQPLLEKVIRQMVDEFMAAPYRFFTEADAVARFHQLLSRESRLIDPVETMDGHQVSLVHREYPTFFRLSDRNPEERLESRGRRGHYDTVILNPAFVRAHPAETVMNRTIDVPRNMAIVPFEAVIETKMHTRGWSKEQARGVIEELGKLKLSKPEAPLRYMVLMMRYRESRMYRWNRYWPQVRDLAGPEPDIRSVFAVCWLDPADGPEPFWFGPWLA
jgi:hypothetical protein